VAGASTLTVVSAAARIVDRVRINAMIASRFRVLFCRYMII